MLLRGCLFIVSLLICASYACCQAAQDDVIYLNNGSFLRGKIVELVPGKSVKISLAGQDTLELQLSEVKLIRKEDVPDNSGKNFENGVKAWGYTFMADINLGWGLLEGLDRYMDDPEKEFSVNVAVFNGFTLTPYIQLGLGTGLEVWSNRVFIPVYLDLRACLIKQDNTPFMYVNAGYSPGWITGSPGDGMGGAMAGIGAGVKFRISRTKLMVLSLGYRFQQIRQWVEMNGVTSKATRDGHFLSLKTGLIF